MNSHHVIKQPLLTEKSTFGSDTFKRYMFLVAPSATKTDIKRAIEDLYKVRVVGVSTHNRTARNRRGRHGMIGGKVTKRTIVRVHEDDVIELI